MSGSMALGFEKEGTGEQQESGEVNAFERSQAMK
jgi:hypothetical protein